MEAVARGDVAFLAMCEAVAREIVEESGLDAVILPPPEGARAGVFLRPVLNRVGDVSHAGAAYGTMVLDQVQGYLDKG